MLRISRELVDQMIAHARADHPDEACGVIAGPEGSDEPQRFIPMVNAERSPTFYRFDSMVVQPCAVQPRVPIWVGGRTRRSLRRAVDLGDGWTPFSLTIDELTKYLGSVDLPDRFAVVLSTPPLDPIGSPQQTLDRIGRLADVGATDVSCMIAARSSAHFRDQLIALAELADLSPRVGR